MVWNEKFGKFINLTRIMAQRYLESYSKEFRHTAKSRESVYKAFCTLCNKNFSIKHSGRYDIKTHQNSKSHKDLEKNIDQNSSLQEMGFGLQSTSKDVIRAESHMVLFLIEHNLSLRTSDHLSSLMGAMFPMCNVAKKFSCKKTKTRYIIKEMGKDCQNELVSKIKEPHVMFSVSTDGSADSGGRKQLYPVLIRYYNPQVGRVITEVLSIPSINEDSTGHNIFNLLDAELKKHKLTWEAVISFCSDNASVMLGKNKGVAKYIVSEHENVFINGCTCHLAAIAARNAAKILPVQVEDLLVDIMCHMKGSSKRHRQLKDIQEACGLEPKTMLAFCATRWLSLGMCIPRLLENYIPLITFFEKEVPVGDREAEKREGDKDDDEAVPSKKVNGDGYLLWVLRPFLLVYGAF